MFDANFPINILIFRKYLLTFRRFCGIILSKTKYSGSLGKLQLTKTCAGDNPTYTTDRSAPLRNQYILFVPFLQEDYWSQIADQSDHVLSHRVGSPARCFVFQKTRKDEAKP